jgi:hypothetical protein
MLSAAVAALRDHLARRTRACRTGCRSALSSPSAAPMQADRLHGQRHGSRSDLCSRALAALPRSKRSSRSPRVDRKTGSTGSRGLTVRRFAGSGPRVTRASAGAPGARAPRAREAQHGAEGDAGAAGPARRAGTQDAPCHSAQGCRVSMRASRGGGRERRRHGRAAGAPWLDGAPGANGSQARPGAWLGRAPRVTSVRRCAWRDGFAQARTGAVRPGTQAHRHVPGRTGCSGAIGAAGAQVHPVRTGDAALAALTDVRLGAATMCGNSATGARMRAISMPHARLAQCRFRWRDGHQVPPSVHAPGDWRDRRPTACK